MWNGFNAPLRWSQLDLGFDKFISLRITGKMGRHVTIYVTIASYFLATADLSHHQAQKSPRNLNCRQVFRLIEYSVLNVAWMISHWKSRLVVHWWSLVACGGPVHILTQSPELCLDNHKTGNHRVLPYKCLQLRTNIRDVCKLLLWSNLAHFFQ
jgi:hypothetical protein